MEKLTTVRELFKETDKFIGTEVAVGGWVRSVRDSRLFICSFISFVRFGEHLSTIV